jgi:hypothetical protein
MTLERDLDEEVRERTRRYLDRYGWDVAEDESSWKPYQRQRMAQEYGEDEWEGVL